MRRKMMILVSVLVTSLLLSSTAAAAPAAWSAPGYHVVHAGETLWSIGRRYGVSAWAIATANHLPNPNKIYAGQWLYIPGARPPYSCGFYHTVAAGQTLHSIGRTYKVNPWAIASANGIYNLNIIHAGQRLFIPCH